MTLMSVLQLIRAPRCVYNANIRKPVVGAMSADASVCGKARDSCLEPFVAAGVWRRYGPVVSPSWALFLH